MTAVDRTTRCIVSWSVVEERTFAAMQAVVDRIPPTKQFYSDGLKVYRTLIYTIRRLDALHEVAPGKSQTYTVEAVNADLRHYMARLTKKSRCFSRCIAALRRAVWLFVCCYNRKRLWQIRYPHLKKARRPLTDFLPTLF